MLKSDIVNLNNQLRSQFANVKDSPAINIARLLTENLRDGPLDSIIPEIIGGMKINVSNYYWDRERDAIIDVVNTMAEGIVLLHSSAREFLTEDEAMRFVIASASDIHLSIE